MKLLPADLLSQKSVEIVTSSWVNKRVLPILLGVFLFVVTGNYLLFNRYSKNYNLKNNQVVKGQITLKKLDDLKTRIQENETFIKDNNILSNSDYSYFLDIISSMASERVRFTRFQIHPLVKEIRKGKEAKFKNQLIKIEGEAQNVTKYRMFLSKLIAIKRVKEVRDKSYQYDVKNKIGKFSIIVEYELNQQRDA
jgi:hypothetical protein